MDRNGEGEALRSHLAKSLDSPLLGCHSCGQKAAQHATYRPERDPCYGPYISIAVTNSSLRALLDLVEHANA